MQPTHRLQVGLMSLGLVASCRSSSPDDTRQASDVAPAAAPKEQPPTVRDVQTTPPRAQRFVREGTDSGPFREIGAVPPGTFVAIDGAKHTVCALDDSGAVHCFGGASRFSDTPPGPFVEVSSGSWHACGRRPNGSLVCWGSDFRSSVSGTPDGAYAAVAIGTASCALDKLGQARCWGRQLVPPQGQWASMSAGSAYVCFRGRGGAIACAPGDDFLADRSPLQLPSHAAAIFAGYEHVCTLDDDGQARCSGRDVQGETKPPDERFAMLALGEKRSCGVTLGGEARCWGGTPAAPPPGPFTDIAITENEDQHSHAFACAVRRDSGGLACWDW